MCQSRRHTLSPRSLFCAFGILFSCLCGCHVYAQQTSINSTEGFIQHQTSTLVKKYSPSVSQSLSVDNLEHLMKGLGLMNLDHGHEEHEEDHDHEDHDHDEPKIPQNYTSLINSCLSAGDLVAMMSRDESVTSLSFKQFQQVCPLLLNQIDAKLCKEKATTTTPKSNSTDHIYKVWGFSIAAVAIISISGLIVVAVIPLMPKAFYNVLIQFLIALAVGSLAGDALLHLIPHALVPHEDHEGHSKDDHHHSTGHSTAVWKSLVALLGVHLFFFTERLTILCQNAHARRKNATPRKSGGVLEVHDSHWTDDEKDKAKQWNEKPNSHDNMDDHSKSIGAQLCNKPSGVQGTITCPNSLDLELCSTTFPVTPNGSHAHNDFQIAHEGQVSTLDSTEKQDDLLKTLLNHSHSHGNHEIADLTPGHGDGAVGAGGAVVSGSRTHPHKDKPHGHHHGHSHDLSSVRSIAYTIVAGDGLHNFCDGIAIGAAFASDLRGGLSTSIAVFCHELPHELGDFAVLLHAGMSIKSAIFYNMLSSVLCSLGMVLGVLLGQNQEMSTWLFMLTAGMFLYIALVDMMPELSTSRLKGNRGCHQPCILFMWQNIGIILGSTIMLLIALFEDKIL